MVGEPSPRLSRVNLVDAAPGDLQPPQPDHIKMRARVQQVRLGTPRQRYGDIEVRRDRVSHIVSERSTSTRPDHDITRDRRPMYGEASSRRTGTMRVGKRDIMQQGSDVQALTVVLDPIEVGQHARPEPRAHAVVQQGRRQDGPSEVGDVLRDDRARRNSIHSEHGSTPMPRRKLPNDRLSNETHLIPQPQRTVGLSHPVRRTYRCHRASPSRATSSG
jgi:hypothetical protein